MHGRADYIAMLYSCFEEHKPFVYRLVWCGGCRQLYEVVVPDGRFEKPFLLRNRVILFKKKTETYLFISYTSFITLK